MNEQAVQDVLENFREGFQADGADLRVGSVAEDEVLVELLVTEETCRDCILPKEMLENMFSRAIERQTGVLVHVRVEERESGKPA